MVELERLEGHIKTVVDVVEPLGSEVILYLTVDGQSGQPLPLIAKVEAHIMPPVNSSMHVRFNMKKAHLFDKEKGIRL
jgi:ABC-type sugar transport system ATPase subunit